MTKPMRFTDDDLKRLKEIIKYEQEMGRTQFKVLMIEDVQSLLARLEAVEMLRNKLIEALEQLHTEYGMYGHSGARCDYCILLKEAKEVVSMGYPIEKCRYPSDVARIIKVASVHGLVVSAIEAEKAWDDYSDSMCAGWLMLPDDDDEVWHSLPRWFTGS